MIELSETLFWIIAVIAFFIFQFITNREKIGEEVGTAFLLRLFGWLVYFARRDRGFPGVWFILKLVCFLIVFRWLTVTVKLPFISNPLFLLH